jgi:hypothetical protein
MSATSSYAQLFYEKGKQFPCRGSAALSPLPPPPLLLHGLSPLPLLLLPVFAVKPRFAKLHLLIKLSLLCVRDAELKYKRAAFSIGLLSMSISRYSSLVNSCTSELETSLFITEALSFFLIRSRVKIVISKFDWVQFPMCQHWCCRRR